MQVFCRFFLIFFLPARIAKYTKALVASSMRHYSLSVINPKISGSH
jgi:hypothetical protein